MNAARTKGALIVCAVIAAFFVVLTQFRVSTDLALFLPEPDSKFERLLRYQLDNGASANILFLAFSGPDTETLADFNKSVVDRLGQSGTFSTVTNNARSLSTRALEFLEKHRYLLTHHDLTEQFSVSGLKSALQARLEGLASSSAAVEKRYLRNDPTGEVAALLEEWQGKISRHKRPAELFGVWFSDDLSRTLILVEIAADISRLQNQIDAVREIRETYEQIKIPGLEMTVTGPAVFAVESGEDIREDIRRLTLMAVSMVLLFLWMVYRSVRPLALIACTLVSGVIVATATILLVHGRIHGITLAFGITLAGVAVDYPIHLLTGFRGKRKDRQNRIRKIWRTLRLGVLSTVIAYAAFLLSGFGGLQQLGWFTIVGLVTAAAFARWVLPFLDHHEENPRQGLSGLHRFLKQIGQRAKKLKWVVVGSFVLAMAGMMVSGQPILHLNVDSLSPIKDQRRADGKLLRDDLGFWYGGSMVVVVAPDKDKVLQESEKLQVHLDRLVEQDVMESYDMAAHFLPSQKTQMSRKSQIVDEQTLRRRLEEATEDFPFRPGVFEPFLEEVAGTARMALVEPDTLDGTAMDKKLAPLLFDFEGEAGGVVLLHDVRDSARVQAFADQHDGVYYMHLKTASTDMVARSVDRVSKAMILCVILIYLALSLSFRNMKRPLKIMVPAFAAAVVTAAVLVFSGNPLSVFHLVSLLLVVGLGLDYALFFNRLPENRDEWDTTFRSLWVCGVTTVLVFGILMFSQAPPLEAIGLTVGIGAFLSIVFAAMWAATPGPGNLPHRRRKRSG